MQHSTFQANIDGIEIEFRLKQLRFRDQEKVISLVGTFRDGSSPKEQIAALREAFGLCVDGWSLSADIADWDLELDLTQAIKVVNRCLQGNSPSETERKK